LTINRSVVGATALAIGTAVAVEVKSKQETARAVKAQSVTDNDKRYQSLLDAYGSGESLEDLQAAVERYQVDSTPPNR
jgi:hypothetical protein